jgi:mannose-6-phosphate isomerase
MPLKNPPRIKPPPPFPADLEGQALIDEHTPLYPLSFEPIYKEKVWGGRRFATVLQRDLPGDENTPIGEAWEIADLGKTSPSGGGGKEERSRIAAGPLVGTTLHDAMERFGPRLLGKVEPNEFGEFPLLVKFLDARENLSVQVHPSPEYAAEHDDAYLKSEAWYIVQAEPGSCIYKGIHDGVKPEEFRKALEANDTAAVESMLIKVPVKAGDCHYLPSGTCHALGAGCLVAEVQTPSDTTFRVFDWGRTGRELHIEQAMQCIRFGPPQTQDAEKRSHIGGTFTTVSRLVETEYFRIEKIRMSEGYEQEIPYDQPAIWMVLEGSGTIMPGGNVEPVAFTKGQTLLIPAGSTEARVGLSEDTAWLEVTFPHAGPPEIA